MDRNRNGFLETGRQHLHRTRLSSRRRRCSSRFNETDTLRRFEAVRWPVTWARVVEMQMLVAQTRVDSAALEIRVPEIRTREIITPAIKPLEIKTRNAVGLRRGICLRISPHGASMAEPSRAGIASLGHRVQRRRQLEAAVLLGFTICLPIRVPAGREGTREQAGIRLRRGVPGQPLRMVAVTTLVEMAADGSGSPVPRAVRRVGRRIVRQAVRQTVRQTVRPTTFGPTTADRATREIVAGIVDLARMLDAVKVDAAKVRRTAVQRREEITGGAAVGPAMIGLLWT